MLIRVVTVSILALVLNACGQAPVVSQLAEEEETAEESEELVAEGIVYDYFEKDAEKKKLTHKLYSQYLKEGVVMLKYSAPWCVACQRMKKPVANVAKKFAGKVMVVEIDFDKAKADADLRKGLPSRIPEMRIFAKGKLIQGGTIVGIASESSIEALFNKALAGLKTEAEQKPAQSQGDQTQG